ncbi:MAG TPA: hypothetical protein VK629_20435, partial [Steroidobacteraceae bacterium]|nr:hypothetical protein [Steroidobacteraceae bacterium]
MRGIGAGQDGSAVHGLRGVLPSQFEDALAQFHPGHRDTLQFESSVSASRVAFDDTRFFKVANQTAGLHLKTQALWLIRHRDTLKSMLPVVEHLQWAIDETLLITNRIKGSLLREALLVGDSQQAAATFGRALEALQTRFYVLQAQSASAKMLPHILRRTVDRLVAHYFWSREGIQVPLYSERFVCNGTEFGGSLASL